MRWTPLLTVVTLASLALGTSALPFDLTDEVSEVPIVAAPTEPDGEPAPATELFASTDAYAFLVVDLCSTPSGLVPDPWVSVKTAGPGETVMVEVEYVPGLTHAVTFHAADLSGLFGSLPGDLPTPCCACGAFNVDGSFHGCYAYGDPPAGCCCYAELNAAEQSMKCWCQGWAGCGLGDILQTTH